MPQLLLRTNVSEVSWPAVASPPSREDVDRVFGATAITADTRGLCWLDRLLDGGIVLPGVKSSPRALTVLIAGPPGAGKSTFVLELCHRARIHTGGTDGSEGVSEPQCLYVTSESTLEWLRQQSASLKWRAAKGGEWLFPINDGERTDGPAFTAVLETSDFRSYLTDLGNPNTGWFAALQKLGLTLGLVRADIDPKEVIDQNARESRRKAVGTYLRNSRPDILIIDSLNVVRPSEKPDLFRVFNELVTSHDAPDPRPKIIVFVLDSASDTSGYEFWSYLSDIIIRIDRKYEAGYVTRTIEVVKARYQRHAEGRHQLSIHGGRPAQMDDMRRGNEQLSRGEGGVLVQPSIDFYLSQYASAKTSPVAYSSTPFPGLNAMLGGNGFLKGRCVALVGARGTHKTRLGYRQVLAKLLGEDRSEAALVVSLRDDESVCQRAMEYILRQDVGPDRTLNSVDLIAWRRLHLISFPPGRVTPEEFFHRVWLSIRRTRAAGFSSVTLLFNSLDQLSPRFPLCAREQNFVPGLVQMLNAETVTSLFIGVDESPGGGNEQYGLLSMADTVINAQHRVGQGISIADDSLSVDDRAAIGVRLQSNERVSVLRVIRAAGGQPTGACGLLDITSPKEGSIETSRMIFSRVNVT